MTTYYYIPQPPLSTFVNALWLCETDTPARTKERRLPDGSMELVISLQQDWLRVYDRQHHDWFQSFRGGLISGVHSEFIIIDTTGHTSLIGVNFKPGGAFPFLRLPAAELHNEVVDLSTLWGATALDLREQLQLAPTPECRFHILERSLLAHLARPGAVHPAVTFALAEFQQGLPTRTISAVTEQIGLSQKRFIQVFHETVGLTPKQFCRVARFQEALRLLERGQAIRWADLALDCGYFDQAHFIHDFRAFCGLTPSAYLTARGEHRNHVPLPD